jgi:hypothetical protein
MLRGTKSPIVGLKLLGILELAEQDGRLHIAGITSLGRVSRESPLISWLIQWANACVKPF